MNNYLLTLVIKPDLEEKARIGLLDDIKKQIVGTSGKVEKEDLWGNKDLAYPIKRQNKGYFAHFEFSTASDVAKGLDKTLKVEEDIIRYLFVRADAPKQVKKPKKVVVDEKKKE